MTRGTPAGVAIGLAAATLISLASVALRPGSGGDGPFDRVEWSTYDWRLRMTANPAAARRDIVLIEIDEYSLQNLEPALGRWPWPRVAHGNLINFLSRAPAKLVAYDVTFGAADTRVGFTMGDAMVSGAESDAAFAASVADAGNVILLADATFTGERPASAAPPTSGFSLDGALLLERPTLLLPYPALTAAGSALAHNYLALDADGPVRHMVPFVRSGGATVPSLGVAAAIRAAGVAPSSVAIRDRRLMVGGAALPLEAVHTRTADGVQSFLWGLIAFRGPPLLDDLRTRPYPSYAFYDLLYSEEQLLAGEAPKVDPAVFRDKVVFVGVTASGLFDVFETPFSRGKMPGIQVHAAVADDLLSGRTIGRAPATAAVTSTLLLAVIVGMLAAAYPVWWVVPIVGAIDGLFVWGGVALFGRGTWMRLTEPVLASAIALFGGVAYQYFIEGRERRRVSRLFGRFVSKDVYAQLLADPSRARLGGQRREMTVLFSDVRGFTTLTEQGEPEAMVATLNEYFTRMVDLVFLHQGTLDKFVGDMVMALFGAPLDDPEHADHAVAAALDMVDELGRLNAGWQAEGRPGLDIGIGINTGPMIAGNIGSETIMSYTVIGDAVNLGSRLESLNKQFGTRVIISDATRRQLRRRYQLRPLGEVTVKGKTQAVEIFEVVGREADSARDSAAARTIEARA